MQYHEIYSKNYDLTDLDTFIKSNKSLFKGDKTTSIKSCFENVISGEEEEEDQELACYPLVLKIVTIDFIKNDNKPNNLISAKRIEKARKDIKANIKQYYLKYQIMEESVKFTMVEDKTDILANPDMMKMIKDHIPKIMIANKEMATNIGAIKFDKKKETKEANDAYDSSKDALDKEKAEKEQEINSKYEYEEEKIKGKMEDEIRLIREKYEPSLKELESKKTEAIKAIESKFSEKILKCNEEKQAKINGFTTKVEKHKALLKKHKKLSVSKNIAQFTGTDTVEIFDFALVQEIISDESVLEKIKEKMVEVEEAKEEEKVEEKETNEEEEEVEEKPAKVMKKPAAKKEKPAKPMKKTPKKVIKKDVPGYGSDELEDSDC